MSSYKILISAAIASLASAGGGPLSGGPLGYSSGGFESSSSLSSPGYGAYGGGHGGPLGFGIGGGHGGGHGGRYALDDVISSSLSSSSGYQGYGKHHGKHQKYHRQPSVVQVDQYVSYDGPVLENQVERVNRNKRVVVTHHPVYHQTVVNHVTANDVVNKGEPLSPLSLPLSLFHVHTQHATLMHPHPPALLTQMCTTTCMGRKRPTWTSKVAARRCLYRVSYTAFRSLIFMSPFHTSLPTPPPGKQVYGGKKHVDHGFTKHALPEAYGQIVGRYQSAGSAAVPVGEQYATGGYASSGPVLGYAVNNFAGQGPLGNIGGGGLGQAGGPLDGAGYTSQGPLGGQNFGANTGFAQGANFGGPASFGQGF
jgi:hypothetical protein